MIGYNISAIKLLMCFSLFPLVLLSDTHFIAAISVQLPHWTAHWDQFVFFPRLAIIYYQDPAWTPYFSEVFKDHLEEIKYKNLVWAKIEQQGLLNVIGIGRFQAHQLFLQWSFLDTHNVYGYCLLENI